MHNKAFGVNYSHCSVQAVLIYVIMLSASMHFLFNFRLESLCLNIAKLPIDADHVVRSVRLLSARVWGRVISRSGYSRVMARARVVACARPEAEEEEKNDNSARVITPALRT